MLFWDNEVVFFKLNASFVKIFSNWVVCHISLSLEEKLNFGVTSGNRHLRICGCSYPSQVIFRNKLKVHVLKSSSFMCII